MPQVLGGRLGGPLAIHGIGVWEAEGPLLVPGETEAK